jgi:hypothetical protein
MGTATQNLPRLEQRSMLDRSDRIKMAAEFVLPGRINPFPLTSVGGSMCHRRPMTP